MSAPSRWARLTELQLTRPWTIVLLAFLLGVSALPLVGQLSLNGDFTALLPEHKPSVQDLEEIRSRFGRQATLTLAVQAKTSTDARAFVRELAPRIAALDLETVSAIDWNVSAFERFVESHRHLYAPLEDLEEIRDVLDDRLSYELGRANPLYVDLEERDGPPPEATDVVRRLEARAQEARDKMGRFPGGYFQHPELPLVVMFIRTTIKGGETGAVRELLAAIDGEVEALGPDRFGEMGGITVDRGGELMDIDEEQAALTRAVLWATTITVVLVMLAIYLFFRRIRSIPLLGLAVLPPVLITFGVAELAVDYLNASSAFLSSIVVGNGINPNVIWLARYFESRREGRDLGAGVLDTHRTTWAATLTASLAAGAAYASLVITDFRGFRDFGIIGGTGMALCWLSAYLLLPALVVLFDRRAPMTRAAGRVGQGGGYGRVFAGLAVRAPRTVAGASVLLALFSAVIVYLAIRANPMEYDFRNLQSQRPAESRTQWVNDRQGEIVDETTTGSAIAILVDEASQVDGVVEQLERYRAETSSRAFGTIRTVWDLLPKDQDEKLEILEELADILPKLEKHADAEEKALLAKNAIPEDLEVLTPEALPQDISRYFAESDGSLGKIVFLEHDESQNNWDGQYMVAWAKAARSVTLPTGERPAVAGQPPVFADLLEAIWGDGPRAVLAAFVATCSLLILTFSRWSERLATIGALLLGILWMAALMALGGVKLNFLNFVAFPITFGNGVDYGVNVMRRYVQELEGRSGDVLGAVRAAVEGTGGAVVLCSLTTIVGYISLYTSTNRALNSFGAAMAISEVTCVVAGVLTLPALLVLAGRGVRAGGDEAS
ncbi:MAG: MMPL family transporter [Myxococcota bacterium]